MLNANSYPLCFVTTAANPEVSRDSIFSQGDVGKIPGQKRVLEFWVIIVAGGPTSEYTQKSLYSLVGMALNILENNQQLRIQKELTISVQHQIYSHKKDWRLIVGNYLKR